MPANKREDFSVNTIVGPNTYINGDVNSAGFTRVDGNLHGDLTATGRIVVGERARMKSNVTGTAVTIGGVVFGNVLASERVIILTTGIVLGDIITQRIQADEGCLLHGRVMVCQTREKWNNAVNEYRDREDVESVTAGFAPRLNPAASDASVAELSPETINLEPEAGDQTAASGYAALPWKTPFAGEQAALEFPAENAPVTTDVTVSPEDAAAENPPALPDDAPPENAPVPPEDTLPENTVFPAAPFPGAANTGENHGES